ncbi:MAG TPA: Uma2 family endonuclease [Chloroflexi bacterium]|nr:Uma2 family endonuclease [Chloroflexota bacterium]
METVARRVEMMDLMSDEDLLILCGEDVKADLIGGVMVVQTPASFRHQRLERFLLSLLGMYVEEKGLGEVVASRMAVYLGRGYIFEPDILFVTTGRLDIIKETHVGGAPDLVVEILSSSSAYYDRGIKREIYERFGVKELWLLDPYGPEGTQFLVRKGERFEEAPMEGGIYRSQVIEGFWLKADWLWPEGEKFPPVRKILSELMSA